jgi:YD repeat-containing protein
MDELVKRNHIDIPVKTENFVNTIRVSQEMTKFKIYSSSGLILPDEIHSVKGNSDIDLNATINKKITYDSYDSNGNLLAYTIANGIKIGILWGYKDTLPIAKIENYNWGDISTITTNNLRTLSETGTEADLIAALNNLRNNPDLDDAMITTYTYKPLIGISTITDPKGYTTYYEYDDFNRLKYVKDKDGKILSKNEYHYKGQ